MANQPQQLPTGGPRSRPASWAPAPVLRRLPGLLAVLPPLLKGAFDGAAAALGGLALLFAPVYVLWIISPDLSGGAGSVLRTATCLWFYGHGAALWRTGVDGAPVPVGVTPLLLSALFAVLLRRAAVRADARGRAPAAAALAPAAGYLAVGLLARAAWVTGGQGGLSVRGMTGAGWLVAWVAVLVGGPQLRRLRGPLLDRAARWGWYRRVGGDGRVEACAECLRDAVRAACAGALALLAAGAAVWLVAVLAHLGGGGRIAGHLAPDLSGRLALLLLCALFAPNAAVAGSAAAVGAGFQVPGGGLIAFPLLGAVPGGRVDGSGGLGLVLGPDLGAGLGFVLGPATPAALAAGVVVGLFARRAGRLRAALARALLAAAGVGLLAGAGAWAAGGALGVSALAWVGPPPLATGLCAAMWTVLAGVPATVVARGGLRALDPSWLLRRETWAGMRIGSGFTSASGAGAGSDSGAGSGSGAAFRLRLGLRERLTRRQEAGAVEAEGPGAAVGGPGPAADAKEERTAARPARPARGFDPTLGGALGGGLADELGAALGDLGGLGGLDGLDGLDELDDEDAPPLRDERTSRLGGWRTALRDQAWRLGSRPRR
ncbi:cell division protein PerM [Phaeacidiphilus oryzae]|uniref:cell division protein PerM n=1 Tax=Phaeacidiphilus oryzae TaxID=348818 RepID=UPI0005674E1A|nr:DUF6350 family protein [Phaeacidiphilus oryzae]